MCPSLNTDSPLDAKIKGKMLAELFTLIGVVPYHLWNEKPGTTESMIGSKGMLSKNGKLSVYTSWSGAFNLIKKNFIKKSDKFNKTTLKSGERGDFDLSCNIKS